MNSFVFLQTGDHPFFVLFLFWCLYLKHTNHLVPPSPIWENPGAKCELTFNLKPSLETTPSPACHGSHLSASLGHSVLVRDVLVAAVIPELETRQGGDLEETFVRGFDRSCVIPVTMVRNTSPAVSGRMLSFNWKLSNYENYSVSRSIVEEDWPCVCLLPERFKCANN